MEVPNLPGDPDNVSRDDLVFADGSVHLVNVTTDFSSSIDPRSCAVSASLQQTQTIEGGTGRFTGASGNFAGTSTGQGIASRNSDRSCALGQPLRVERDNFTTSGSLSF